MAKTTVKNRAKVTQTPVPQHVPTMADAVAALPVCAPDMKRMSRVTYATGRATGRLIDCVTVATPWSNGFPRPVLVLRTTHPTAGTCDGVPRDVPAGELLHVDAPELALLSVLCSGPERVHAVTLHPLPGLCRWAADVSRESFPRE